jgi:hypothetical protein
MDEQNELNVQVEANLRAIWKGGAVVQPTWTPDQIGARAAAFEAQARRLALADMFAFILVPVVILAAAFVLDLPALLGEPYGRIQFSGAVLLFLCSVLGALWSRRYSHAAVGSNANDLLASHLERLARLRDWYISTPWGSALYLPGAGLVMIGSGMNPKGRGWEMPIIWAGVAIFVYLASCIQMKIKARALQREIDSLEALRSVSR